jgi:peptide/nickel transport system permease protein
VLILISLLSFVTLRLLPGDPARSILGPEAPPDAVKALRDQLGWDRPIPIQYVEWVGDALKGDFGRSLRSGQPVLELVAARLPVTVLLALFSLVIAIVVALPVGIIAALRRNTVFDYLGTVIAVIGAAIPNFWLAMMLVVIFSVRLGWLPSLGWVPLTEDPVACLKSLVLPSIALGAFHAAIIMRMTRSAMLEVLNQDYVRTARAKGLGPWPVVIRHALRNALVPIVTIMGLRVSQLLGGAIIIESVFALPGMGKLVIDSILYKELVTVQALVLLIASSVAISNLVIDLLYPILDPRIRYA